MPIIKLSNGLRVCNFSSPHDFSFEDSSILKACSLDHAEKYKVNFNEVKTKQLINNIEIENIELSFSLSDVLLKEVKEIIKTWKLKNEYDLIIIPLTMLNAIKENKELKNIDLKELPFRVIRMRSRTEKKVKVDQFCL